MILNLTESKYAPCAIYDGPIWENKGDSTVQSAEQSQANLANTLSSLFQTQYQNQTNVLNSLQSQLQPFLTGLQTSDGFVSPAQEAALRTSATDQNSAAFSNAVKAYQNQSFALGGRQFGSGVQDQNLARINTAAAQQQASSQNALTQFGYQTGLQNFWNAASSLLNVAGIQNPLGYSGSATSALGDVGNLGVDYQKTQGPGFLGILGGLAGAASNFIPGFSSGALSIGSDTAPTNSAGVFGTVPGSSGAGFNFPSDILTAGIQQ